MVINTLLVGIWTSKALPVRAQKEMRNWSLIMGGKETLYSDRKLSLIMSTIM